MWTTAAACLRHRYGTRHVQFCHKLQNATPRATCKDQVVLLEKFCTRTGKGALSFGKSILRTSKGQPIEGRDQHFTTLDPQSFARDGGLRICPRLEEKCLCSRQGYDGRRWLSSTSRLQEVQNNGVATGDFDDQDGRVESVDFQTRGGPASSSALNESLEPLTDDLDDGENEITAEPDRDGRRGEVTARDESFLAYESDEDEEDFIEKEELWRMRIEELKEEAHGDRRTEPDLYLEWGNLEYRLGHIENARRIYRRGTRVQATFAPLWQAWGILEKKCNNVDVARKLFRIALKADPVNIHALHGLAVLEDQQGNRRRARELLMQAHGLDRSDAYVLQSWALLEAKEGNMSSARQLMQQAVSASVGVRRSSLLWQAWGNMEKEYGDLESARRVFETGHSYHKKSFSLIHSWALMEGEAGEVDRARQLFERALRVNDAAVVWSAWASMEIKLGNIDSARELYQTALDSQPRNIILVQALADLERRCGNLAEARSIMEAALQWDDELSEHARAIAIHCLGQIAMDAGELEQARSCFREAVSLRPGGAQTYQIWSKLELESGNTAKCKEILQEGSRNCPSDHILLYNLGSLHYHQGEKREAVRAFQIGVRANPLDSRMWAQLLSTLLQLQDFVELESSAWSALQRLFPGGRVVKEQDRRNVAKILALQGRAYLALDRPRDAVHPLQESLLLDIREKRTLQTLSKALKWGGRLENTGTVLYQAQSQFHKAGMPKQAGYCEELDRTCHVIPAQRSPRSRRKPQDKIPPDFAGSESAFAANDTSLEKLRELEEAKKRARRQLDRLRSRESQSSLRNSEAAVSMLISSPRKKHVTQDGVETSAGTQHMGSKELSSVSLREQTPSPDSLIVSEARQDSLWAALQDANSDGTDEIWRRSGYAPRSTAQKAMVGVIKPNIVDADEDEEELFLTPMALIQGGFKPRRGAGESSPNQAKSLMGENASATAYVQQDQANNFNHRPFPPRRPRNCV